MELNFIKCGDYYIPDIKVKNPNIRLGKWGRMRKEYLRLANPVLFSDMDVRSIIPVWLVVVGLGFSGIVALLSALAPAIGAMRISPLEAIRAE